MRGLPALPGAPALGEGFACRFCGEIGGEWWQMGDGLRRCKACRAETSVTAGTILAGPGTVITFVCVRDPAGVGATRQASVSEARAEGALHEALQAAADAGAEASGQIMVGHDPGAVLVDQARDADLLVVASHGGSRAGGIVLGGTASAAAHRAKTPVLIARRPPEGSEFPDRILVASDGSDGAHRATRLAGAISRRHRSRL